MVIEQFFRLFANTPLGDRDITLDFKGNKPMTLADIYKRLKELQDAKMPYELEEDKLLRLADNYYIFK